MISLGLDQALVTTGWSVFNNNKLIDYGKFTIPANKPIEVRLNYFWKELNNLLNTYNFEYVFFEDIQQQRGNVETYKKLAYCQASILLWCYFHEIKYSILSPSHWRSILKNKYNHSFGKSRAEQKNNAQKLIKNIYDISLSEDEADAVCLHLAGIQEWNQNRSAF